MFSVNIEAVEPFGRLRRDVGNFYDSYLEQISPHFEWLSEILEESKETLGKPGVELLPRTPAEKRKRGGVKRTSMKTRTSAKSSVGPHLSVRHTPKRAEFRAAMLSIPVKTEDGDEKREENDENAVVADVPLEKLEIGELAIVERLTFEEPVLASPVSEAKISTPASAPKVLEPTTSEASTTFSLTPVEAVVQLEPLQVEDDQMEIQEQELLIETIENSVQANADAAEVKKEEPIMEKPEEQPIAKKSSGSTKIVEPIIEEPTVQPRTTKKSSGTMKIEEPIIEEPTVQPSATKKSSGSTSSKGSAKLEVPQTSAIPRLQSATRSASKKNGFTPSCLTPRLSPKIQINRLTPQKSTAKQSGTDMREKLKMQLQEATLKREEQLRQRIDEQKRKREERYLRVAQARLKQEAQREALKRKIEEKYQTPLLDFEEKRNLRPRIVDSAAKGQDTEYKRFFDREKEMERIRREKEELQRLAEIERDRQLQKPLPTLSSASKTNSSLFKPKLDVSLVKLATVEKTRGTFVVSSANSSKIQEPCESYAMTPPRVPKPSTATNYDISDLRSDDETDDEDHPRKKIPLWASGGQLNMALTQQYYRPPDLNKMFGVVEMPDLTKMFKFHRKRFFKRTSSAKWDSPIKPHSFLNASGCNTSAAQGL